MTTDHHDPGAGPRPGPGLASGPGPVSDPDCVFCGIAAGTEPSHKVEETADTLTFLPRSPVHPGHVLVAPRRHVADIWELDDRTAATVGSAVLRAAHAVRAVHRPQGLNVIQSSGEVATQSVFHLHVHVVPRYEGDRMPPLWPEPAGTDTERLDESVRRLREALESPHR